MDEKDLIELIQASEDGKHECDCEDGCEYSSDIKEAFEELALSEEIKRIDREILFDIESLTQDMGEFGYEGINEALNVLGFFSVLKSGGISHDTAEKMAMDYMVTRHNERALELQNKGQAEVAKHGMIVQEKNSI